VTGGDATLTLASPNIGAAANAVVSVSVITDDGAVLNAGKYTYQ
jgi:hypothetical protein